MDLGAGAEHDGLDDAVAAPAEAVRTREEADLVGNWDILKKISSQMHNAPVPMAVLHGIVFSALAREDGVRGIRRDDLFDVVNSMVFCASAFGDMKRNLSELISKQADYITKLKIQNFDLQRENELLGGTSVTHRPICPETFEKTAEIACELLSSYYDGFKNKIPRCDAIFSSSAIERAIISEFKRLEYYVKKNRKRAREGEFFENDNYCPICYDDVKLTPRTRKKTPCCNHEMCRECFYKLKVDSARCAFCRAFN